MAVTARNWQQAILAEVGAYLTGCSVCDPLTDVGVEQLWAFYEDQGASSLRLQYLYTKRHAIDWLLGQLREKRNSTLGPLDPKDGELFTNLLKLRELVTLDIKEAEGLLVTGGKPIAAEIEQTAPVMVESGFDPNHPVYRGSPIYR